MLRFEGYVDLLILRTRAQVFGQRRLNLSDCITTAQGSQSGEDPMPPESKLGIIWRRRIRVDEEEHVGGIPGSIGLNLISKCISYLFPVTYLLRKLNAG